MSDMIDSLSTIANEVGEQTASRMAAPEVTVALQAQIARGVRRRRTSAAALAGSVLAVIVAAIVVVPQLLQDPPLTPAEGHREVVATNDSLVTYDDGSMQVATAAGSIVDIPPPAPNAPTFGVQNVTDACTVAEPTALPPGWVAEFPAATELVTFGRPLLVDAEGYHVLRQGQQVHVVDGDDTAFAFSVDVDPAIAPFVMFTMNSYIVMPDGTTAFYTSQLESQPAIDYTGDQASGTYTATVTTSPMAGASYCEKTPAGFEEAIALGVPRYMSVVLFINDGSGHLSPIAQHNSWVTIIKEDS